MNRQLFHSRWRLLIALSVTLLTLGCVGVGTGVATGAPTTGPTAPSAPPPGALKVPCPNGHCATAKLQAQVDALKTTIKYWSAHASTVFGEFTHPGPLDVVDYNLEPLWEEGIDGYGTTVAVMEQWDYPTITEFMATFDKFYDLPSATITTIFPNGPLPTSGRGLVTTPSTGQPCPKGMVVLGGYGSCGAWEGELILDVASVHFMAPYAKIVISATPADSQIRDDAAFNVAAPGLMKAVEYISSNHIANVMSISDGTSETTYSYGWSTLNAQNVAELTAAANGVPLLVATGDCGVIQNLAEANSQCSDGSTTPQTAAWDDSPWILAVGGSVPHISTTGVKTGIDTGWPTSGAGFSSIYPRPAYQDGTDPSPMRSVPDITMDSSDGTSEAAPSFAGVLALATQLDGDTDLGPIQTALYKIGPLGARAGIVNITTGNDSTQATTGKGTKAVAGFSAGPGFNVDTGWGTVTANKFVFSLDNETRKLQTERSARSQAASQVASLQQLELTTTPNNDHTYVFGQNLLPNHPVTLFVTTALIATLTVSPQGYVTYMITATVLGLTPGVHTAKIMSMLVTELGTFSAEPSGDAAPIRPATEQKPGRATVPRSRTGWSWHPRM